MYRLGARTRRKRECSGSFADRSRPVGRCTGSARSGRRGSGGLGRSWWRCRVACSCRRRARRSGIADLACTAPQRRLGWSQERSRWRLVCSRGFRCSCGRPGAWCRSDRVARWAAGAGRASRGWRCGPGAEGLGCRQWERRGRGGLRGGCGLRGRRRPRSAWADASKSVRFGRRSALTEGARVRSLSAEARHALRPC